MKTSQIRLLVLLSLASLASLVGLRSLIACDPTTATIQWQVTVPAGTPEQAKIFLAGNHELFGPWKPNVFPLEKRADGTYHAQAQLPIGMKLEYKFTRGDWDAVEKSERGSEIPNRTLLVQKDTTVQVTIASWANRLTPTLSTATGDLRWKDFDSQILHGQRRVTVWLPPGYRTSPMDRFPVLYMLDGQNVFDAARAAFGVEWQADEAARDLFFSKPSRPLIIVAIDNSRERKIGRAHV